MARGGGLRRGLCRRQLPGHHLRVIITIATTNTTTTTTTATTTAITASATTSTTSTNTHRINDNDNDSNNNRINDKKAIISVCESEGSWSPNRELAGQGLGCVVSGMVVYMYMYTYIYIYIYIHTII